MKRQILMRFGSAIDFSFISFVAAVGVCVVCNACSRRVGEPSSKATSVSSEQAGGISDSKTAETMAIINSDDDPNLQLPDNGANAKNGKHRDSKAAPAQTGVVLNSTGSRNGGIELSLCDFENWQASDCDSSCCNGGVGLDSRFGASAKSTGRDQAQNKASARARSCVHPASSLDAVHAGSSGPAVEPTQHQTSHRSRRDSWPPGDLLPRFDHESRRRLHAADESVSRRRFKRGLSSPKPYGYQFKFVCGHDRRRSRGRVPDPCRSGQGLGNGPCI